MTGEFSAAFLKRIRAAEDAIKAKEKATRKAKREAKQLAAPASALKIAESSWFREKDSGRYMAHNSWERQCVCGHALGDHSAEGSRNSRPCFVGDVTHVICECEKFRQKKSKGQNLYTEVLAK